MKREKKHRNLIPRLTWKRNFDVIVEFHSKRTTKISWKWNWAEKKNITHLIWNTKNGIWDMRYAQEPNKRLNKDEIWKLERRGQRQKKNKFMHLQCNIHQPKFMYNIKFMIFCISMTDILLFSLFRLHPPSIHSILLITMCQLLIFFRFFELMNVKWFFFSLSFW